MAKRPGIGEIKARDHDLILNKLSKREILSECILLKMIFNEDISFGQGSLGKIIKRNLLLNSIKVILLPLRKTAINEYVDLLLSKQRKIIIDLMDPNSLTEDTDKSLISKAKVIRDKLSIVKNLKHYIYISSASIYRSSLKKIDENSLLKLKSLSPYEKLKLENEKSLIKKQIPLTICRVQIFGVLNQIKSFLMIYSMLIQENKIKYLDNDKNVISYLYVNDLISLIILIIYKRIF